MKRALLVIVGAALIGVGCCAGQPARPGPEAYSRLRWRYIGPEGNRILRGRRRAGRSARLLRRRASGGIFKTTDGGVHWQEDSSTSRSCSRSARSPSRRPIRTSSGPAPARRSSAATSRSATASTSRPTPARRGRGWASRRPAASAASSIDPQNPGHRARLRARPRLRPAAGARRLPHDRRRQDVDARAVRRREHRLLRHRDGSEQPAHPVRRHVAARDPHLGARERRAGQRPVQVARRRRDVDSG